MTTSEEKVQAIAAVLRPFERQEGVAEERARSIVAGLDPATVGSSDMFLTVREALELRVGAFHEIDEAAERVCLALSLLDDEVAMGAVYDLAAKMKGLNDYIDQSSRRARRMLFVMVLIVGVAIMLGMALR